MSVWFGEIQWMRRNGFSNSTNPILNPLETIECRDVIVALDGSEPDWPQNRCRDRQPAVHRRQAADRRAGQGVRLPDVRRSA